MLVFDPKKTGSISLREFLMAISMSMTGTPKEKLHWAYKLYDKDGNGEVEIDEMEDVFVRLCKIASNIKDVEKAAKLKAKGLDVDEISKAKRSPSPNPKKASDAASSESKSGGKAKSKFRVKVIQQNAVDYTAGVIIFLLMIDLIVGDCGKGYIRE